jgi:hypothetical protein
MGNLIAKIENWIDETLESHCEQMVPCKQLSSSFDGYFSEKFLINCFYIVVPELPKPDFPELRDAGFGSFIDDDHAGITYKNGYFIRAAQEDNLYLHLHELVHVCQWTILGAEKFITTYMEELQKYGYEDAPLEQMAKAFEYNYSIHADPIDVMDALRDELD